MRSREVKPEARLIDEIRAKNGWKKAEWPSSRGADEAFLDNWTSIYREHIKALEKPTDGKSVRYLRVLTGVLEACRRTLGVAEPVPVHDMEIRTDVLMSMVASVAADAANDPEFGRIILRMRYLGSLMERNAPGLAPFIQTESTYHYQQIPLPISWELANKLQALVDTVASYRVWAIVAEPDAPGGFELWLEHKKARRKACVPAEPNPVGAAPEVSGGQAESQDPPRFEPPRPAPSPDIQRIPAVVKSPERYTQRVGISRPEAGQDAQLDERLAPLMDDLKPIVLDLGLIEVMRQIKQRMMKG